MLDRGLDAQLWKKEGNVKDLYGNFPVTPYDIFGEKWVKGIIEPFRRKHPFIADTTLYIKSSTSNITSLVGVAYPDEKDPTAKR